MKQFLNLLLISFLFVAFSCDRPVYTSSDVMTETGNVIAKQYRGESITNGHAVGLTTSGDMVFAGTQSYTSQQFDVIFTCEHGVIFTINDDVVYSKVREHDTVMLYYREKYKNGELYDYEFVSVSPMRNGKEIL